MGSNYDHPSEGVLWVEKRAGQQTATSIDQDDPFTIHDPELAPDWLKMPDTEGMPDDMRGRVIRVECSVWLNLIPDGNGEFIKRKAKWHLLQCPGDYAVVEVLGHEFMVVAIGPKRASILRDIASISLQNTPFHVHAGEA